MVKPNTIGNGMHHQRQITPLTMAIFKIPDPFPVSGPSYVTPRPRMVGNMIELNNATTSILRIAVPAHYMENRDPCRC